MVGIQCDVQALVDRICAGGKSSKLDGAKLPECSSSEVQIMFV